MGFSRGGAARLGRIDRIVAAPPVHRSTRILVAGAGHHLGRALVAALVRNGYTAVQGDDALSRNLAEPGVAQSLVEQCRPEVVVHAAGRSGGIGLNRREPAALMTDNLETTTQLFEAARTCRVPRLLYLASSCVYPRDCPQPMRVEHLHGGRLEPTNEAYALAKLAGITLCQAYRQQYGLDWVSAIPTNHFGPDDDFSPENSHVVGALLRKMHEARRAGLPAVTIWGTGQAVREFLYDDDLAEACRCVLEHDTRQWSCDTINLAGGQVVRIAELARIVQQVVGYQGQLQFDATRPDGMPAKVLDGSALAALGWRARWSLAEAVAATYARFVQQEATGSVESS